MAITVQEAQVVFSADGMRQVDTTARKASRTLDGMTSAAKRVGGALSGVKSAFTGVGGIMATVGATAGLVKMAQLTMEAEKTAISFEVLTGSVDKATKLLQDLRALDKKTVFGLTELSQAQKLMMNFGLGVEESFSILQNLTEVAQGDTEQLMLLARGMAQVKAAGRLMGQEANQLINSGFSPLFEISKATGRGMADLKKDMENGLVSYDMVRNALERLTTGTGRLAGMNDKLATTAGGALGKFQTNVEQLAIALGNSLLPEANKVLDAMNKTAEGITNAQSAATIFIGNIKAKWTETSENLQDLGVAVGFIFASLPKLIADVFTDIATKVRELVGFTIDAGKAIANNLSPSVIAGTAERVEMPELIFTPSISRGSLREGLQAELDAVRRGRIEQRQQEGRAAAKAEADARMKQQERGAAPPMIPMEETAQTMAQAVKQATSERGSALSMFQRLQDQLSGQTEQLRQQKLQAELQAKGLDVSKQILSTLQGGLPGIGLLG